MREEGLAEFNTNAVARRSPCSLGTVYNCFSNKAALLQAMIINRRDALAHGLTPYVGDERARVRHIAKALLAYHMREPKVVWLLLVEEERLGLSDGVQSVLRAALRETMAPPRIRPRDPDMIADDLTGMFQAMAHAAARRPDVDVPATCLRMEAAAMHYMIDGFEGR